MTLLWKVVIITVISGVVLACAGYFIKRMWDEDQTQWMIVIALSALLVIMVTQGLVFSWND